MNSLMCPYCGWKYDPNEYRSGDDGRSFALVPMHCDGARWEAGGAYCPGTDQHPRNPETDKRPLWKDVPKGA